jgi:hypothetical protein
MQHHPEDSLYHNPFDDGGFFHDPVNSSGLHHDPLTDAHQVLGPLGSAALGNVDPAHAGLSDIFQLFNLGPINNLFQAVHSHESGNAAPPGFPIDLGPLTHLIDIFQTHPAHNDQASRPVPHVQPLEHFEPSAPSHAVIGNPAVDMDSWYHQIHHDTCAIASQGFIIESLTGHHIPEDILMHEAQQNGWYSPGGGTPMYHVGDLLEAYGIQVLHKEGASLADIAAELRQHQKVIVGVNGEDFWYHGSPNDPLADYPGIPGQHADHAVEVIGINDAQPDHPLVIINDPGSPNGRGVEVPADLFYQAWSTSGYYMVATTDVGQNPATGEARPGGGLYGGVL